MEINRIYVDDKSYAELPSYAGLRLRDAVRKLKYYDRIGGSVFIDFNGVILYSDTVTMDSAYIAVTGKTASEYDIWEKECLLENQKKEEEHKAKIPQLIDKWKEKGREVLDEKYWALWDEILPIRLNDLYKGMELGMCLDIVKVLNEGCGLKRAKMVMDYQGHSYMSHHLVRNMVRELCDRGEEFSEFVKD